MSDKITSGNDETIEHESVNEAPNSKQNTALNAAISSLKSYPILGWLLAGGSLLPTKLEQAASRFNRKLDETQQTLESMQAKGLEVEGELKRVLNLASVIENAQKMVTSMPLFSLLSGATKRQQKEQKIVELNAKVDLLVEQVAILAAQKATARAKASQVTKSENTVVNSDSETSTETEKAPVKRRRRTTTKDSASSAEGVSAPSKPRTRKTASATPSAAKPANAGETTDISESKKDDN